MRWRARGAGCSPSRRGADAIAGLSLAMANVPDGMANGVLVGVNPLYGLHAAMAGPLVGGIVSSTRLMVITTTAAASLTAGQSLVGVPEDRRVNALLLLAIPAGALQILFGVLGRCCCLAAPRRRCSSSNW